MITNLNQDKYKRLIDIANSLADTGTVRLLPDGYLYAEIQDVNFTKALYDGLLQLRLEDDINLPDNKDIGPHISLAYPEEKVKLFDARKYIGNKIYFKVLTLSVKVIGLKRYYILTIYSDEADSIRKDLGLTAALSYKHENVALHTTIGVAYI